VHATIAGILLATTIPCRQRLDGPAFLERSEKRLADFRKAEESGDSAEALGAKSKALHRLTSDCQRAEAPMLRFEHALAPWIRHFVMPAFALANAGVSLGESGAAALFGRISLGVICGLVLGKPVGIAAFTWLSVRTGASSLPDGVNWRHIVGAGFLAGIGFTMSLFVGTLAFDGPSALDATKIGVLTASLISGAIGAAILARR
jgi:NhaA family Na+:H+ antiporter